MDTTLPKSRKSRKKLSENQKLLRKTIRTWARDRILNKDVSKTNQAAMLAGFHYAINMMFDVRELREKALAENSDVQNMTVDAALRELDNLMRNDTYTQLMLGELHGIAVRKGMLPE